MPDKRKVISRIPVEPELLNRLRRFSQGAGVTYNELLTAMLDDLIRASEDEVIAGHRYWQLRQAKAPKKHSS